MLAYVFWHTPAPSAATAEYERSLIAFQQSLLRLRPPAFQRAVVFRIQGAPWIGEGGPAYEERYLLDGSHALDVLNWAAVSSACREAHDQAARQAGEGTAGLYRLREEGGDPAGMRFAAWFSKPAGWSYESLYARVAELTAGRQTALWTRQMVLGPAPELCLQAATPPSLPDGLAARVIPLQPVWPTA